PTSAICPSGENGRMGAESGKTALDGLLIKAVVSKTNRALKSCFRFTTSRYRVSRLNGKRPAFQRSIRRRALSASTLNVLSRRRRKGGERHRLEHQSISAGDAHTLRSRSGIGADP